MFGAAPDLVLGALCVVISLAQFLISRLSTGRMSGPTLFMVAAALLLVMAEFTSPLGARAGEVLPAFYALIASLLH